MEWAALLIGATIYIVSFILDFLRVTQSALESSVISAGDLFTDIHMYVPQRFDTEVFFVGFFLMLSAAVSNMLFTNRVNTQSM